MNAGKLTHRVTLQSPAGARDALGERVTTWVDEATVWAAIEPLTFRESTSLDLAGGQEQAGALTRVTVRHSSQTAGIAPDWRVLYGSRVLVLVQPPRNPGETNEWLELVCSEGLRQE